MLITELKPHPENLAIYGDEELDKAFLESIKNNGVLVPLSITPQGVIISGHRRWRAGIELGFEELPVEVLEYETLDDERKAIIEFNRQREKTFIQKMKEADVLLEIEKKKAEQRMLAGVKVADPRDTCPQGRARDKIAEQTGIGSGRTYERARLVWQQAKEGNEKAVELVEKVEAEDITINQAYKQVKKELDYEEKKKEVKEALETIIPAIRKTESNVFNMDCMEGLKDYPDGFFDLAIIDPPYGIGADKKNSIGEKVSELSSKAETNYYGNKDWDEAPSREFFIELKRVSKRQIIWGVNYLPYADLFAGGRLFWDKDVLVPTFSRGEIAYLSFQCKVDYVRIVWDGMRQEDMKNKEKKIHPTQKPVKLYEWLLEKYSKPNDKILDTHMGSQNSRVASYKAGLDYWGFEIDKTFYDVGCLNFEEAIREL